MAQNTSKPRVKWIDILKGICIIFVMLSHSYPPDAYIRFFTPFFLTMFFFASGRTFSLKSGFWEFLLGKIRHLVIPLLLLGSIRILGMWILGMADLKSGFIGLLLQISCKQDELWFISCIFTASLLLYCIIRISRKLFGDTARGDVCILICSALLGVWGYIDILFLHYRFIWEFEIACIMMLYFALGYLYKKYEPAPGLIPVLILSVLYIASIAIINQDVDIHKEHFGNVLMFIISSFLVILPLLSLTKWLEKTKLSGMFVFLGQNTLFYFAFSGFVREIFIRLLHMFVTLNPYIESVLCTIVMILVLIIPAKLVRRFLPWLVGA